MTRNPSTIRDKENAGSHQVAGVFMLVIGRITVAS